MGNVSITKENLQKAYNEGCSDVKKVLKNLFGADVIPQNIMDRVKSFKDACKITDEDYDDFMEKARNSGDSKDEIAYKKLKIIARALNEGWKPDYKNSNEYKYYPWFEYSSSGSVFGFACTHYLYTDTATDIGPRLVFKSKELTEYAGKQFIEIYNDYLIF